MDFRCGWCYMVLLKKENRKLKPFFLGIGEREKGVLWGHLFKKDRHRKASVIPK